MHFPRITRISSYTRHSPQVSLSCIPEDYLISSFTGEFVNTFPFFRQYLTLRDIHLSHLRTFSCNEFTLIFIKIDLDRILISCCNCIEEVEVQIQQSFLLDICFSFEPSSTWRCVQAGLPFFQPPEISYTLTWMLISLDRRIIWELFEIKVIWLPKSFYGCDEGPKFGEWYCFQWFIMKTNVCWHLSQKNRVVSRNGPMLPQHWWFLVAGQGSYVRYVLNFGQYGNFE